MKNEFEEYISEDEVKEIASRISMLTPEEIDELFYSIVFVVSEDSRGNRREQDQKALPKSRIREIKQNQSNSKLVRVLLEESPIGIVRKKLNLIESKKE